jgi:hypothetical protein
MHDCRKMKEELVDLVFNEVDPERELLILEESERCRACREEYSSMCEALNGFDEAAYALMPREEFWTEYHSKLEARLDEAARAHTVVVPFWRRALRTSFHVPVPVAVAAALLLAVTSVMAIRSFISQSGPRPTAGEQTAATAQQQPRVVEVPVVERVVEEKIVTRTVYVTKRPRTANQAVPSVQGLQDITAKNLKETNTSGITLNGFQPPSDVKLTVIKGSFKDEK